MIASPSTGLATDARSIDALKAKAAADPKAAIRDAAKQFEALFMQALMKSMRQATLSSGMLDNAGTEMGTEMLDTQFATRMTGLPGGLGDVIARQLERQMGSGAATQPDAVAVPLDAAKIPTQQAAFVRRHDVAAQAVAAQSGIPAAFMLGQAAHESGWGRHEIRNADGATSHNLFGIKADANWKGAVAEVATTEFEGGVARKSLAKFRAYASYEESFRDYARLIRDNPRYQQAYGQAVAHAASAASGVEYAQGLQRAGYATDPAYADKLGRVINTTLRLQRAAEQS
jgi:peptidoglycan hydrolase FlgJ